MPWLFGFGVLERVFAYCDGRIECRSGDILTAVKGVGTDRFQRVREVKFAQLTASEERAIFYGFQRVFAGIGQIYFLQTDTVREYA